MNLGRDEQRHGGRKGHRTREIISQQRIFFYDQSIIIIKACQWRTGCYWDFFRKVAST
jgi:hypothetical protein